MNQNHTQDEPHYYQRLLTLLLIGLLGMMATAALAQTGIRYNIRYIGGSKYQVSMTPNVTLLGNDRLTATAQVTIKTAPGSLTVTNVQSLPQSGLVWNTTVQKVSNPMVPLNNNVPGPTPMTSANADYFIFGIPPSSAAVPYVAGVEIPLYTFDVAGPCGGELSIWEANDIFQPNLVNLINVGNNLNAIGFQDPFGDPLEGWIGNYDAGQAPCPPPGLSVITPVNTTATTTPSIAGTATPGSVITINGPGLGGPATVLCSTSVSAAGTYSCPVTVPVGPNSLTAVACSPSSCTSCTVTACTSVPFTFTAVNVVVPPTVAINSPANGSVVASLNPPITGTATAGASVTVTAPGGQSCVTTAAPDGSYTCTSLTFTPGRNSVSVVAGNGNGVSPVATTSFVSLSAQPAFACGNDAYLFQSLPTDVLTVNLATGASTLVGTSIVPGAVNRELNAVGYNALDNYIWGSRRNTSQIVRVGSDYSVQFITIPGLPALGFNVGDVNAAGVLHLYVTNTSTIYRVDVNPASPTYLTLLPNVTIAPVANVSDWAFSPIDGNLYGVDDTSFNLYRINPTTGVRANLGVVSGGGIQVNQAFGAAYMDNAGSLYVGNNTSGQIFKITTPNLGNITATLFANGPASTANDGARCANTPVIVGPPTVAILSPATNGTATTTPTVSGTATPNALVTILGPNNTTLCSTTAAPGSGTYACPVTVPAGPNTLSAVACNAGGCANTTTTFTAVAPASLTVAPNAPGPLTQLVSGTATPGSIITITDPAGNTLCSTTATAGGTFSCPVSVTTGVTPLTVTACNVSGCSSVPTSLTNIGAPPLVATAPPVGGTTQTVSGTTSPNTPVTITGPGNVTLCTTTSDAVSGTFACPVTVPLGPSTLTATACNIAGCTSQPVPVSAVAPPSLTVVNPAPGGPTQLVSGTGTPGSTIAITDPAGNTLCATTVSASGTFACPVSVTTGVTPLTVTSCNPAGCIDAPISVTNVGVPTVDIMTPPDGTTQPLGTNVVSGTATPGSTVILTASNGASATITMGSSTTFSVPGFGFPAGPNSVTATVSSPGGLGSPDVNSFTVIAPPSLTVVQPPAGPLTQVVSGTATPGSTVAITDPSGATLCTTTADLVSGTFACPVTVPTGVTPLTVAACNAAGCTNAPISVTAFGVPTVAILSPATNTTQPIGTNVISGTATPGSTLTLTTSNGQVLITTVSPTGSYSLSGLNLPEGVNSVTVCTSNAGGKSTPAVSSFTVVAQPTVAIQSPPNGTVQPAGTNFVSGTATPGTTVTLTTSQGQTLTTVASPTGQYSFTGLNFPTGPNAVTVCTSNLAGKSPAAVSSFTIAGIPPTVAINTPLTPTTTNPVLSGTATPGSSVTVLVPGNAPLVVTADPTGNWSTPPGTLTVAPGPFTATAVAGNTNGTSQPATIGLTAGNPPTIAILSPVTGATTTTTPTVSGTATPGATVAIYGNNNVLIGATVADLNGNFSAVVSLAPGSNTITAIASNVFGQAQDQEVVTAVGPPSLTVVQPPAGTTTQVVSGTATPGSVVSITDPTGATLCSTTVGASGTFACPVTVTATGVTPLTVTACNLAGCLSGPIAVTVLGVPMVDILTPPDNTTQPIGTNVVSGTATPGSTVVLTASNGASATITMGSSTTFSVPGFGFSAGPNSVTATVSSPGGLGSPDVNSFTIIAPPSLTVVQPPASINPTQLVSGTATPGSVIAITNPAGQTLCTTTADPVSGTFACPVTVPTGVTPLTVAACNSAGCTNAPISVTALTPPPTVTILSPTNGSTASTTPILSGTATPGSTVTLTTSAGQVLVVPTDPSGNWSTPPGAITYPVGPGSVTAVAGNAGGPSAPASTTFTVQTQPVVQILTPALNGTATSTPTIGGFATPGSTITLVASNGQSATVVANPSGIWSVPTFTFVPGLYSLTATTSNGLGTSAPSSTTFSVPAPPSLAVVNPPAGPTTQVVSGTATPGSVISVTTPLGTFTTTVPASGTFALPVTVPAGVTPLTVTACNAVGCTTAPITLTATAAPVAQILSPTQNGTVASTNPTIVGVATPNSSVTITGGPGSAGGPVVVTADPNGFWATTSLTFTPGIPGTVTAVAGNPGGTSVPASVTFNTPAPTSLTVVNPVLASTMPTITGTATPGSSITICGPGGVVLCQTTASASGTFACPISVTAGVVSLTVKAAGPGGTVTAPLTFTALAPPTVAIVSPMMGSTAVSPVITGTATPGSSVTITGGPGSTGGPVVVVADPLGQWATTAIVFAPGTGAVTATAGNVGGVSAPATTTFTVPAPPSLTVVSPGTSGTAVVISGTATPGSVVVIYGPGPVVLCSTVAANNGAFACGPIALPFGPQTLTVTAFGPGGSTSVIVPVNVVIQPVVTIVAPIFNAITPTNPILIGTATPGSSVTLTFSPNVPGAPVVVFTNVNGVWTTNGLTFAPGSYTMTAVAGISGFVSLPATTVFTVVAPPVLVVQQPIVVVGPTATVSGTATPGSTLVIYGPGPTILFAGTVPASGVFSVTAPAPGGPTNWTITASNLGGTATVIVPVGVPSTLVSVPVKVMLQGSLVRSSTAVAASGLMRDNLRVLGLIPTTEPYTALGYAHMNGGGGETITNPAVLGVTGQNAIVDWVVVELRTVMPGGIGSTVVATRTGLVQADGDVVATDGVTPIAFNTATLAGSQYHVAVHHRNHLGAMTATPITLSGTLPVIDFTSAPTAYTLGGTLAATPTTVERGIRCLWAGNTSGLDPVSTPGKRTVRAQGPLNDIDPIFFAILNAPGNTSGLSNFIRSQVYLNTDVDMDGRVIFQGNNNEVDVIIYEVLGHPSNQPGQFANYIIREQIP